MFHCFIIIHLKTAELKISWTLHWGEAAGGNVGPMCVDQSELLLLLCGYCTLATRRFCGLTSFKTICNVRLLLWRCIGSFRCVTGSAGVFTVWQRLSCFYRSASGPSLPSTAHRKLKFVSFSVQKNRLNVFLTDLKQAYWPTNHQLTNYWPTNQLLTNYWPTNQPLTNYWPTNQLLTN